MVESEFHEKLMLIQFHQILIVEMLNHSDLEFNKLIIRHGLSEKQVNDFHHLCEQLSMDLEEQKAEGFLYFHPLYQQFSDFLPNNLSVKEVIQACIKQKIYLTLMNELNKY